MPALYHSYSIWLFTYSDLKTIVFPSVIFGISNAVAYSLFNGCGSSAFLPDAVCKERLPTPAEILARVPQTLFWVYINLLPFAIENQRQPDAIREDAINKPWRTLPSHRLSPSHAKHLVLILYTLAVLTSVALSSGLSQCVLLICLGYWYNHLAGGDSGFLVRNFINACGYLCFTTGALHVAVYSGRTVRSSSTVSPPQSSPETFALGLGWQWCLLLAAIIFTTVQTQDMYDQRGDSARGRRTMPLVIGDTVTRRVNAVAMTTWSFLVPWVWAAPLMGGSVAPVLLGMTVAVRTMKWRSEDQDRATFRVWTAWLVSIFAVPLIKALERRQLADVHLNTRGGKMGYGILVPSS